jgi:hypothetical protein
MPNIQLARNLQTLRKSHHLTQEYLGKYLIFLTKEEIDMILDYRALSSETKKMIRNFIKA